MAFGISCRGVCECQVKSHDDFSCRLQTADEIGDCGWFATSSLCVHVCWVFVVMGRESVHVSINV